LSLCDFSSAIFPAVECCPPVDMKHGIKLELRDVRYLAAT
jgi:hypothetical protein